MAFSDPPGPKRLNPVYCYIRYRLLEDLFYPIEVLLGVLVKPFYALCFLFLGACVFIWFAFWIGVIVSASRGIG